ncbi:fumarylacetoacetate hydrolase family protein [Burkholderia pyrrocinia]|uniref:fumarylacetoacetate hydrolase family protein n=1 Tax=Burkholderia pyrrocinia TaxID=60550 RepID=UPI002AB2B397|nr:fumarylacetoacetate hydrolase family protein [Burkholderia pyrrocinia]
MRIASYTLPNGTTSYGAIDGTHVRDAGDDLRRRYPDLKQFLTGGEAFERLADGAAIEIDSVRLLTPVRCPDKIICVGLNYMDHIKETGREVPQFPSIFTRFPQSIVGHNESLIIPSASSHFDFEGELAVIIGKRGRHIPAKGANHYIAGYTCFNDGSIRDFQRHTSQFWPGKNFDQSGSCGPWLVTADEMGDLANHSITTRLNGNVMQCSRFSELAIGVAQLIQYISTVCELSPGDVIATGTPGGVGAFRDPKVFMKAGDRVEIEISGIGILSNIVEPESAVA